jgi:hypothetical protein
MKHIFTLILGLYLSTQATCGHFDENGMWVAGDDDLDDETRRNFANIDYYRTAKRISGYLKSIEVKFIKAHEAEGECEFNHVVFDVLNDNDGIIDTEKNDFDFDVSGVKRFVKNADNQDQERLYGALPNQIKVFDNSMLSGVNLDYYIPKHTQFQLELNISGDVMRNNQNYLDKVAVSPFYFEVGDWPEVKRVPGKESGTTSTLEIPRRAVFRVVLDKVKLADEENERIDAPPQSERKLKLNNFFTDLKKSLSDEINQKMDQLSVFMEKASRNRNSNFMKNKPQKVFL